ncbi:hypothetical protein [Brevibacillus brevis]|uniref:hypothetical protein n=1 Tax=Brevibacillus brevis TaxID=1393 RepID=UPI00165EB186|nr:hypothetical protein [Brevibacillus brevis]
MQAGRDAKKDLEMCGAATDGPWEWSVFSRFIMGKDTVVATILEGDEVTSDIIAVSDEDAKFIVDSRVALPHWIQRAVAAEEEVKRLQTAVFDTYPQMITDRDNALIAAKKREEKLTEALQMVTRELESEGTDRQIARRMRKVAYDTLKELRFV